MSARKYRHEDGTGRKRSARTKDSMDFEAAVAWLREQVGDGYEAMMPRGTEVEWYSPMTPAEVASEAAHAAAAAERTERWERETYERLRSKYGPPAPFTRYFDDFDDFDDFDHAPEAGL